MTLDTSGWSGEGAFTQLLIEWLQRLDTIDFLKVEDAPASRSEADYNFVSNEMFVTFASATERQRTRRFGMIPIVKTITSPRMNLSELEQMLAASVEIGAPDYSDEGMLQYLRTERVVPPYQTRGYKLVELVRIYQVSPKPEA